LLKDAKECCIAEDGKEENAKGDSKLNWRTQTDVGAR
jgi:hypothetical protein